MQSRARDSPNGKHVYARARRSSALQFDIVEKKTRPTSLLQMVRVCGPFCCFRFGKSRVRVSCFNPVPYGFRFSDRFVAEWSVIGVCHDVLCRQCLDVDHQPDESATDRCPVCHTTFDRKEDVKTNIEMQIAYDEMEDFLWKILAAE